MWEFGSFVAINVRLRIQFKLSTMYAESDSGGGEKMASVVQWM